jgi:DNA polymerase III subunit delta
MKILSREDLRNLLLKKEIAPIYLLFGEETYLRDLAAQTIANIALRDSALRDFNESEISLNESELKQAVAAARQLPMVDRFRVIRVTDIAVTTNTLKNNLKEEEAGFLDHYFSNPSESSVVIFIADELDKRLKMARMLLENCVAVEFKALDDGGMMRWAKDKLDELKVNADEKALRHLVGLVGNNVRKLTLEIEKLAVAALPEALITYELVDSLVPNSREISNFDLADHLLAKNKTKALQTLKKILDDGAEPLMLLGLLSYNFHRLFLAKEMMNEGVDRSEVSKVMRLPYNKQQNFLETARRTEREKFRWILQRLAETDLAVKTSVATPRLQIEMLICELVNN